MGPIAFVTSFTGVAVRLHRPKAVQCSSREPSQNVRAKSRRHRVRMSAHEEPGGTSAVPHRSSRPRHIVGIVGKSSTSTKTSTEIDANAKGGLFGMRANAYWESMGVLPLFFAGFGIVALGIKMLKVKSGEIRSGPSGINKVTIPKTAITTEEEEAELHVFKCGGCGYEIYPARGREFKFFPDSFKCPLCGTPKSEFWDLNDPDDPRNQEDDEEDDDVTVDDDLGSNGTALVTPKEPSDGSGEAESTTSNRAETDSSA